MMKHSFLLSAALCALIGINTSQASYTAQADTEINAEEKVQKHPLPPYPTEKEIENTNFSPDLYGYMRNVFETINNKTYEKTPSFDCTKAKTEVEKLICSDKELSELDAEMALFHKSFQYMFDLEWVPSDDHSDWLKDRNNFNCNPKVEDKRECLISLYKAKIREQKAKIFIKRMYRDRLEPFNVNTRKNERKKLDAAFYELFFSQELTVNDIPDYRGRGCPVFFRVEHISPSDLFVYLLKKGANVNYSHESCPPILFLATSKETYMMILEAGADVNVVDQRKDPLIVKTPGLADELLKRGANPNAVSPKDGTTPLMEIVQHPNPVFIYKIADVLIKSGADLKARDKQNRTAYDIFTEMYRKPEVIEKAKDWYKYSDDELNKYINDVKALINPQK